MERIFRSSSSCDGTITYPPVIPAKSSANRLHFEIFAADEDLTALVALPLLEIKGQVYSAESRAAADLVCLTDNQVNVHGLADPVVEVENVLNVEHRLVIAMALT